MSHPAFVEVLRHVGYPAGQIDELMAQLADPVDFDRDAEILDRYLVDRSRLTDRIGGSP
jgi:ribosomal protein S18